MEQLNAAGPLKYQNLREALDDFPTFSWTDIKNADIHNQEAFRLWMKDYVDLMQAIQDGTVKYEDK